MSTFLWNTGEKHKRKILFWSSRELTHSKQRPRSKLFIRPAPHCYYYHFFLKAYHGSCLSLRIWRLIKFRICRVSAFHIARALDSVGLTTSIINCPWSFVTQWSPVCGGLELYQSNSGLYRPWESWSLSFFLHWNLCKYSFMAPTLLSKPNDLVKDTPQARCSSRLRAHCSRKQGQWIYF